MTATRTKAILIKLTPHEHAELSRVAKESGLGLGPWLRVLGLAAARENDPRALWAFVASSARIEREEREKGRR